VTLANGDRITGEVKRLDRGRLEFSTDDAGTLYLEWDKLVSVVATRPSRWCRDGRLSATAELRYTSDRDARGGRLVPALLRPPRQSPGRVSGSY
jgi:hypothetical protein